MSTFTVGLVGRGKTATENLEALVTDLVQSKGELETLTVVLGVDSDAWGDSHDDFYEWLVNNDVVDGAEIKIIAVHDQEAKKDKGLKAIIEDADDVVQVQQVARKVAVEVANRGDDNAILALWDEELDVDDDDAMSADPVMQALDVASKEGVDVLDLTDGLDKIIIQGEDAEGGEEEDEGQVPTREELEAMDRDQLKKLVKAEQDRGNLKDVSLRAHVPTLVDALDGLYESLANGEDADEGEPTEEAEEPAEKATDVSEPEEDEQEDVKDKRADELTSILANMNHTLNGINGVLTNVLEAVKSSNDHTKNQTRVLDKLVSSIDEKFEGIEDGLKEVQKAIADQDARQSPAKDDEPPKRTARRVVRR